MTPTSPLELYFCDFSGTAAAPKNRQKGQKNQQLITLLKPEQRIWSNILINLTPKATVCNRCRAHFDVQSVISFRIHS